MPVADLTAEELELVEKLARVTRKDIILFLHAELELIAQKMAHYIDEEGGASILATAVPKLTDNAEEVLGVKVGTIKRLATDNVPEPAVLWSVLKEVL